MKVRLNFARSPFRNERLAWMIYGLAAAVLLVGTVFHGLILTRYLMREQEELDVKVEALRKDLTEAEDHIQRTEEEIRAQRDDVRGERIRFLASLYRHKGFSWTGLFNELETLTPPAVRITSISPAGLESKDDEVENNIDVEMHVVARRLESVLEMVRNLEAAQYLTTVQPLVEAQEEESGGPDTVTAVLSLQYLPHKKEAPAVENAAESGATAPPSTGDGKPGDEGGQSAEEGNKEASSPVETESPGTRPKSPRH